LQEGRTALIWAAVQQHTDVVNALIEKGADMNAKEKVRLRILCLYRRKSE
jgi:ankyrin repeat protein